MIDFVFDVFISLFSIVCIDQILSLLHVKYWVLFFFIDFADNAKITLEWINETLSANRKVNISFQRAGHFFIFVQHYLMIVKWQSGKCDKNQQK